MKKTILFILLAITSVVSVYGTSSNNDCYWYLRCLYEDFDNDENPISSSAKYISPKNNAKAFEIQFDYASNFQDAEIPVTIYLNEIDGRTKVRSEKLGSIESAIKSSIEYKDDAVSIFIEGKYQLSVSKDGIIYLYSFREDGGKLKYANVRVFECKEMAEIHKIRYKVLVDKLKKINFGKKNARPGVQQTRWDEMRKRRIEIKYKQIQKLNNPDEKDKPDKEKENNDSCTPPRFGLG